MQASAATGRSRRRCFSANKATAGIQRSHSSEPKFRAVAFFVAISVKRMLIQTAEKTKNGRTQRLPGGGRVDSPEKGLLDSVSTQNRQVATVDDKSQVQIQHSYLNRVMSFDSILAGLWGVQISHQTNVE